MKLNIIFISFLLSFYAHGEAINNTYIGEYALYFEALRIMPDKKESIGNIHVYAHIKKGRGVAYIVLPVEKTKDFKFVKSLKSDNNLLLLGYPKSSKGFVICQISLNDKKDTYIEMAFRNIRFELSESIHSASLVSLPLYFGETKKTIQKYNFSEKNILELKSVRFLVSGYSDSYPASKLIDLEKARIISQSNIDNTNGKIVLQINKIQNDTIIYWALGVMGILIGYMAAPKYISTNTRANNTLIFGVLGLIGVIAFIFGYLNESQRFSDTTTIVTFGTICGIIIGLVASALQFLFISKSSPSQGVS